MSFIIYNAVFLLNRVAIGSKQHLLPIIIAVILAVVFLKLAKQYLNKAQQAKAIHIFACTISLVVISYHVYKFNLGNYNWSTDLPLYLCSLLGIIIPIFTYYRTYWMYEILLFWIIGGTLQGVITPDIPAGFPSFDYFRYWVVHLGLLIVIFYMTFVFNMQPKFKSVFKSFFALQGYVLLMIAINYVLDANYFYLNKKPESASLLEYFGEWPWYILVGQIIIIPLFLVIYLPFYLTKKTNK
jgi:hypothetical integral membrane protein (TIGR02206 family)